MRFPNVDVLSTPSFRCLPVYDEFRFIPKIFQGDYLKLSFRAHLQACVLLYMIKHTQFRPISLLARTADGFPADSEILLFRLGRRCLAANLKHCTMKPRQMVDITHLVRIKLPPKDIVVLVCHLAWETAAVFYACLFLTPWYRQVKAFKPHDCYIDTSTAGGGGHHTQIQSSL